MILFFGKLAGITFTTPLIYPYTCPMFVCMHSNYTEDK